MLILAKRLFVLPLLALAHLPAATFEELPIEQHFAYFEQNLGQADPDVRYIVQGPQRTYELTADSLTHVSDRRTVVAVRFAPEGASPAIESIDRWPGVLNHFEGPESAWLRGIPAHHRLRYGSIAPGIDIVFSQSTGITVPGSNPNVTFTAFRIVYSVAPGAAPSTIQLTNTSSGARSNIDEDGNWTAEAAGGFGALEFTAPRAWQGSAEAPAPVDASFAVTDDLAVGVDLGVYDPSRAIYVETTLLQRFLGPSFTSAVNLAYNPFVDAGEDGYFLAGSTSSQDICRISTGGTATFCNDAIVARLDRTGVPVFLTTMSGQHGDTVWDLQRNESGEILAAGITDSADFPVTADAFQPTNNGPTGVDPLRPMLGGDMFLARLDPTNGDLSYATFFGGPDGEGSPSLDYGPTGGVSLLASSEGDGFPVSAGAWVTSTPCPVPGCSSPVLAHLDDSLTRVHYATYLPRLRGPVSHAMSADGSVFAAGSEESGAAPTTPGSLQTEPGGGRDAYLLRMAPDGSAPIFATYFGDESSESVAGLQLDEAGNATLLVNAEPGPFTSAAGRTQVIRVAGDGSHLLSAGPVQTLESPQAFPFGEGELIIFGEALSPVLATTDDAPLRASCASSNPPYLARWTTSGAALYGTYLPSVIDADAELSVGPAGSVSFLTRTSIVRAVLGTDTPAAIGCVTGAASRRNFAAVSPGEIITILGSGIGPQDGVAANPFTGTGGPPRFPTTLGGVSVSAGGLPAPLLYAQSGQINAVVPYGIPTEGSVPLEVSFAGGTWTIELRAIPASVGLFSLDASGQGPAAALNQDGTLNSAENPATPGSIVVLYGTGIGVTHPLLPDGGLGPIPPDSLAYPVGSVRVYFGGQLFASQITGFLYAGSAPGLINGAAQFNIQVPADSLPHEGLGAAFIWITVDGAAAQNSVTVWVRE